MQGNCISQNANIIQENRNLPIIPVVIDPILASKMRPHQREGKAHGYRIGILMCWRIFAGVQFLYECVMGMCKFEGQGCILADEMWATIPVSVTVLDKF